MEHGSSSRKRAARATRNDTTEKRDASTWKIVEEQAFFQHFNDFGGSFINELNTLRWTPLLHTTESYYSEEKVRLFYSSLFIDDEGEVVFENEGVVQKIDSAFIASIIGLSVNRKRSNRYFRNSHSLKALFEEITNTSVMGNASFTPHLNEMKPNQWVICNWWGHNVSPKDKQTELSGDQMHTLLVLQKKSRDKDIALCLCDEIEKARSLGMCTLPCLATKIMEVLENVEVANDRKVFIKEFKLPTTFRNIRGRPNFDYGGHENVIDLDEEVEEEAHNFGIDDIMLRLDNMNNRALDFENEVRHSLEEMRHSIELVTNEALEFHTESRSFMRKILDKLGCGGASGSA